MAKKSAYEAASASAVLLDKLDEGKSSVLSAMLRQVFSLLRGMLLIGVTPTSDDREKFITKASDLEKSAATVVGRLSSATYRKVLDSISETPSVPVIAPVEHGYDWGSLLDESFDRVNSGELVDDVITSMFDMTFAALESSFDDVEADTRSHVYSGSRVKYWRRVVHPEHSRGGVCGLCLVASTRPYTTHKLNKIHDNCKCTVLPLTADYDLGDMLGKLELGDLYRAASDSVNPMSQSTVAAHLKHVRVNSEGEIVDQRGKVNLRKNTVSDRQAAKTLKDSGELDFWDNPQKLKHQLKIVRPLPDSEWRRGYVTKLENRIRELQSA